MEATGNRLCEAKRHSRRLLNSISNHAIYMLDKSGTVSSWNRGAQRMKGYRADEIIGQHVSTFYTPEDRNAGEPDRVLACALAAQRYQAEGWRIRKDGSRFWASIIVEPIHEDGCLTGFLQLTRDISRDRESSEAIRRLEGALSSTTHGVALFDEKDALIFANGKFLDLLGISPERIHLGKRPLRSIDSGVTADIEPAFQRIGTGPTVGNISDPFQEIRIPAGNFDYTIALRQQPLPDGGWMETAEDITEQRMAEIRLDRSAHYDRLTGLTNRALFNDRLGRAMASGERDSQFALLSIDIDRFKSVNETFGHAVGDELLTAVAERLRASTRAVDTVARIGGDEFAVIETGVSSHKHAERLASRIAGSLCKPYVLGRREVFARISIGIALYPGNGTHIDSLVCHANLARHRAKENRQNSYSFFQPGLDAEIEMQHTLEQDLHRALRHSEFEIFYQSIVDLKTNSIAGREALLRWHHPTRGLLSPGSFISSAEQSGLIVPIGDWVLGAALRHESELPKESRLAINLSPAQMTSNRIVRTLENALAHSKISPEQIELEITESTLLQNCETTLAVLRQLKDIGVRVVLDDFGTGFSSLSYLRDFPFDKLKIDRSFIRDLPESAESGTLVKAIVGLGESFHMAVTAEGVESERQLEFVRTAGCTEAQGFYFDFPKPASEIQNQSAA